MKTKLVTSYYAYHSGPPFWGHVNRERWYKYSLISLCKSGLETVCYTDLGNKGYDQLVEIKDKFNLTNLTIKQHKLDDNPWQDRIYNIRINMPDDYNNPHNYKYYICSQVYWMKWLFASKELEPNINLYWIDCGLSHGGLFPRSSNPYGSDSDYLKSYPSEVFSEIEYRYHQFNKAFTSESFDRINNFSEGKIINLCKRHTSHYDANYFLQKINDTLNVGSNGYYYPIGGFWGGNSNLIQDYVQKYYDVLDKVLKCNNYICTDQEPMFFVNNKYNDMFKNWVFDTFYHEDWKEQYNPNTEVSFSDFFLKNIN